MSVVAIIPARGGSKGILRKNLQVIDGLPLVAWSIRAAQVAKSVDRVYVSTEDNLIAAVARNYGADVIQRPAELATDEVVTLPVLQHAIEALDDDDLVVLLDCTTPFTTAADIDGAVDMLARSACSADVIVSVCRDESCQVLRTPDGIAWVSYDRPNCDLRRQDLPAIYRLSANVFVHRVAGLRTATSAVFGTVRLYEIPKERTFDIHDPIDLHLARALAGILPREN